MGAEVGTRYLQLQANYYVPITDDQTVRRYSSTEVHRSSQTSTSSFASTPSVSGTRIIQPQHHVHSDHHHPHDLRGFRGGPRRMGPGTVPAGSGPRSIHGPPLGRRLLQLRGRPQRCRYRGLAHRHRASPHPRACPPRHLV
ncbi:MAG: hypothetical protein KDN20_25390 [Verrucomicrobiae bacterium]|nr:hypothetical protein [Verrucomicrobiae bacterium]